MWVPYKKKNPKPRKKAYAGSWFYIVLVVKEVK